jgi:hypothetical protein
MTIRPHLSLIATFSFGLLVCALVVASIASAAEAPSATTGSATDVAQSGATLVATVNPRGTATSVRFDLGTSTSYGLASASRDVGNGTDAVSVEIPVSSLSASTTYHFRVVATSDGGTVQGSDATFRTASAPAVAARPGASTGGVKDVSLNAATLTATVDPNNASTSYRFQYGLTTAYGATSATGSAGGGSRGVPVSQRIGGLTAGKRYHYRVVATNSVGTTNGGDHSFVVASTATSATLAADHDPVRYGDSVRLSGTLGGSRISGVRVRLQTTTFPYNLPFADFGNSLVSDSRGQYTFTLPSVATTTRALVVVDGLPPFFSAPVTIRSAARAGITSVTRRADGRAVVVGSVVPTPRNAVAALQRQSSKGTWLPLKRAHVARNGRWSITLAPRRTAITVRAIGLTHDGGAHVSGTSRTLKIAAARRR